MSLKTKNAISMYLNIIIFLLTCYAIGQYFTVGGSANMMVGGWMCLRFFTNLSNIFVAIASLIVIYFNIYNVKKGTNTLPRWAFILKFTATVSVTLTFLTVVFFLGPTSVISNKAMTGTFDISAYFRFFEGPTFFLHFLTPILAMVSFIFFEACDGEFKKSDALWGLVPTIAYSIVYFYEVVIVGVQNGGWYDFYGFTFGGNNKMIPISMVGMYLATYLIARVERWANLKAQSPKTAQKA